MRKDHSHSSVSKRGSSTAGRQQPRISCSSEGAAAEGSPPSQPTAPDGEDGPAKLDARIFIRFLVVHGVTLGLTYLVTRTLDFNCVAATSFAINWLAAAHSILNGMTEKYYDFTGMVCYISCVAISAYGAWISQGQLHIRQAVNSGLVLAWTARLGTYLYARVVADMKEPKEQRNKNIFDDLREHPSRFFGAWTVQGLWVLLVALPVFILNTIPDQPPLGLLDVAGWAMWTVGFVCEAVADSQKGAFKRNPANKGRYINSGIWAWSQHPNYFGEILLWCGMVVTCGAASTQWAHGLALLSPLFTMLLLLKVTGIPQLQKAGQERWGEEEAYQRYRRDTSLLLPRPPRKQA